MKVLQYICLHVKIAQLRFCITTPFTLSDMGTLVMQNVCLQTYRNNGIC